MPIVLDHPSTPLRPRWSLVNSTTRAAHSLLGGFLDLRFCRPCSSRDRVEGVPAATRAHTRLCPRSRGRFDSTPDFLNSGSTSSASLHATLDVLWSVLPPPLARHFISIRGDHASRRLVVVVVVVRLGNDVRSSAFLSFCAVRRPPRSSPASRLEPRSRPGTVVARSHLCRLAGGRARPGTAVLPSTRKAVPRAEIWARRRGVPGRYAGSLSSLPVQLTHLSSILTELPLSRYAVAPQDVVTSTSKAGTTTTSAAAKGSQLDRVPPRPDVPSLLNPATNSFLSYLPTMTTTTTIPLSALPPLPPLKSSSESTLVLPPLPPIPSFHHPHHHLPSTPPELPPQQATNSSPQSIPTPSETAAPPDFDPGEFLNASLALFQSGAGGSGGSGGATGSQPTSPTLVFPSLPPIAPPPSHQFAFVAEPFSAPSALGKLETVPEDDYDESLWSAGEDPLGSCAATDVTSEASWAW